jgi:regulator of sigma E protease
MTTLLSFLFVLGVLVFVHELGHFLVARWYGVRVITFSLGFGPKIVKYNYGGTEYCISAIPLGGFVKLAGETVEDNRSGAPDEFLAKSKWVRFQVYIAGPIMNILLALIVLAGVLTQGADLPAYESAPAVIGRIEPGSPAASAGLAVGDRVMTVNARPVPTWESFLIEYVPRAGRDLQLEIDRAGTTQSVLVRPTAVGKYEFGYLGVSPVIRPKIAQVISGTPAERAGFQNGDVLLSVGGERGLAREQVIQKIRASAGAPLAFIVERAGQEVPISVVPEGAKGSATVGLSIQVHDQMVRIDPTLLEAFRMSAEQNWANAVLIGRTLKGLFTADTPVRQLVGPMGIAEMSGAAAEVGWVALFNLMAMISLNLGLLNLMPVPVLDGGHIAILAAEGLARRDFSVRVKERILMAGAAVVVLLMVTVLYNDFARLLR